MNKVNFVGSMQENPHYADTHAKPTDPGHERLSGSKKVKNQNHTRNNRGEGSGHK